MKKLLRKYYWKVRNAVHVIILMRSGNMGLLPTRKDPKDRIAHFGGFYRTAQDALSYFKYQYKQADNICTAASAVMAVSEQTGIRWSVKAVMAKMVKDGQVNGNGFSHQRAPLDVMVNAGLVPYEDCPDENDKGWADFSKWTPEMERLFAEVAPKYKMHQYKTLKTEGDILSALDLDYVPIVASDWYSGMNRPQPASFLLRFVGSYVGGHAFRSTGYRGSGEDFETPQTFGQAYGLNGKAWSKTLIGKGYYQNFIVEAVEGSPVFPVEVVLPIFLRQNEGKIVKGTKNSCYLIENGKKRGIVSEEIFNRMRAEMRPEMVDLNVKDYLLNAVPGGEAITQ